MAHNSATKSIDVGSMFLMDLSVHESELNGDLSDAITVVDNDSAIFSPGLHLPETTYHLNTTNTTTSNKNNNRSITYANRHQSPLSTQSIVYPQQENQREYLSNSLDRLASAINADGQYKVQKTNITDIGLRQDSNLVTIVEPRPSPEIVEHQSSTSSSGSSSLSDESFVASSGNSLSASYIASSEAEDEERGSTTTREDSGVLDMKDLDSQLNNSYDYEPEEEICQHNQRLRQEKPISSTNTTATNLINKSANNHNNNIDNNNSYIKQHPNRPNNKPTNSNDKNYHHHHHYHHNLRGQSSKRSMPSASLPIQVPARQMKKDLNKLKLGLLNKNNNNNSIETNSTTTTDAHTTTTNKKSHNSSTATSGYGYYANHQSAAIDDVDEFLDQEYNDNHHNHYPIDEYDEEHLRADDNPMKLFESIQALARSLHEDTELFGSLPPKRMLESPIRSLALA